VSDPPPPFSYCREWPLYRCYSDPFSPRILWTYRSPVGQSNLSFFFLAQPRVISFPSDLPPTFFDSRSRGPLGLHWGTRLRCSFRHLHCWTFYVSVLGITTNSCGLRLSHCRPPTLLRSLTCPSDTPTIPPDSRLRRPGSAVVVAQRDVIFIPFSSLPLDPR